MLFKDTIYVVKSNFSPDALRLLGPNIAIGEILIINPDSSFSISNCQVDPWKDFWYGYFFKHDDRFWYDTSSSSLNHLHVTPDTMTYYHPIYTEGYRFKRISFDTLISVTPLTYRSLKLYPQPAQTELFISEMPQGKKSLSLLDLLGKVVWHKESWLESEKIDLTDLPKGMYILEVQTESNRFTEKVLKE